ncbi:MAG: TlpA disulfide reductase family protein [Bdellovibrionota bacterium]|nr:TlpA disulfide reductase family protein [Bdellovibrionota bacterium]
MYEKNKLDVYFSKAEAPILESVPQSNFLQNFETKEVFNFPDEAKSANGIIVHFWGTWCAPCEYELPHFLKFSKKLEDNKVKVVLLAVNDDNVKIKKFLKRFGSLPKNVTIVHDERGETMPMFGVVKVPETFIFSSSGKTLSKLVGPQDWNKEYYLSRVINMLGLSSK